MGDNEMRRLFANRLRYYLNMNGYTQADMARYLKVSTATTAKWCTGVTIPRVDKIQSICNWLGIEKSDLLDSSKVQESPALLEAAKYKILFDKIRSLSQQHLSTIEIMVDAFLAEETKEKEAALGSSKEA